MLTDGVLNSDQFAKYCLEEEGYDPFNNDELDPRAIANLKHIVDETSAAIVLSSSWRWDAGAYKAVEKQLRFYGLEIVDTTEKGYKPGLNTRTAEIQDYLEQHPSITKFVILDDDEIKEPLKNHWVHCLFKNGLTKKLAKKAIEILEETNG